MQAIPDARSIHDYLIVGSGPAGSVMAWRLAAAGAQVLMLEAGDDLGAADYPDNELDANSRLFWNGGMEPSRDARLALLRARVVGGGSVVNQCLLDRFDSLALDDWQARTGLSQLNLAAMAPFYAAVESQLSLHHFTPDEWNGNARLYVKGFERCGFKWAPLRRGQSNCAGEDCIVCLGGCPRESKQSMPVTFLRRARQAGLHLLSGVEARQLIRGAHFSTIWARRRQTGEILEIRARKVILAAGALGSSGLLLRSGLGAKLPALGKGFYCHPQYMTLARFREPVDAHKGALQAVKSDDPRFRQQGFKLENVFAGPVAIAFLKPGYGLQHQRFMRDYRHLACMEVAIRDQTPGCIRLDRGGRIQVEKPLAAPERKRARAGLDTIRHIFGKLDATDIVEAPQAIGLHLMGGCSLGQSVCNSVVGADFHLHGMADIMVIDSSVFPSAPGINPALSIMALAWQAADSLLGQVTAPAIERAVDKTVVTGGLCMKTGPIAGMNQQQLRGLSRIGDLMLPGDHLSPAFSELDVVNQVDRVLAEAEPADIESLAKLLGLLNRLPDWALRKLLWLADHADRFPNMIASPLRLLNFGLKGLIVTLYYGAEPGPLARGESPLKIIDYQVHCKPDTANRGHGEAK